jgi:glycosyltransferase involved in cell wall biosynthesis
MPGSLVSPLPYNASMRIVIDARMLYWTGVGRYTLALLEELEQLDHENEYKVLVRRADWGKWEPQSANFDKIECNIDPYTLAEQTALPRVLHALEPDLVHFTTPNAAVTYTGRRVVAVHDLTLLDYNTARGSGLAKLLRGLKRIPFRLALMRQLAGATSIVAPTQYVKDQLVKRFRVRPDRVSVTYESAESRHFEEAQEEALPGLKAGDKFVMYLGNFYPYKNVGVVVSAFARLAADLPDLRLVLAGKRDAYGDELAERVRRLGLAERILLPGFIPDGQLKWLYGHAKLFVYPSLSEGFGLQTLEAMAQGLPVLAANASSLPEVCGDAAVYFGPHDPKDQAEKMRDLHASESLRERLATAGRKRVKQFSWRKMAEETLEVYRQAAGER